MFKELQFYNCTEFQVFSQRRASSEAQFSEHQVVLLACDNQMSANLIKNGHYLK